MAASVGVQGLGLPSGLGGLGLLTGRKGCPYSHAPSMFSGNWRQDRVLKSVSQRKTRSASARRRYTIVSQQGGEGSQNSKVFKSMQEAAERRKEEVLAPGSFDAADVARAISDAELLATSSTSSGKGKLIQPPRFATLRAFGEVGGEGVVTREFQGNSVFELLAASIEASKQVRRWEVLSGRLAMLALSIAIGVEIFTGNSIFKGIDVQKLEGAAALCATATVSAASFAYAWRAKSDVVSLMSKGYQSMVDSALDNLIDGLFSDETS